MIAPIAGFVTAIKGLDTGYDRRFFIGVIPKDEKYALIITDSFVEANGAIIDVSDYKVFDEFDSLEAATFAIPAAMIAVNRCIKEQIEEAGGIVDGTAIHFS